MRGSRGELKEMESKQAEEDEVGLKLRGGLVKRQE